MTFLLTRPLRFIARATGCLAALVLASCGGSVSAPPIVDTGPISIVPAAAVMFSGLPTTFILSGGSGSYFVTSSNQSVLAVSAGVTRNSITLVPNPVVVDTTVTLTVRNAASNEQVTATVTVKPGTVNNNFTITPSSTQGGSCSPAICSGGDATVSVTLSLGGVAIANRSVRFDVVSGDFQFILTSPTGVETLARSATVVSDETGKASARLRVAAAAPNQTALLKATDLVTSAFQQTSFVIAQATAASPGFFAIPTSVTFTGARVDQCAQGVRSSFFIFGGTPPYDIANTSGEAFTVTPTRVQTRGGSFSVIAQGVCADPGFPIGITDAAARTLTVTVANKRGTDAVPDLVVAPDTVQLSSCIETASVTVAGGTGNYLPPSSGSDSVFATPISDNSFSIGRKGGTPATASPVLVGVSDSVSTETVTVNLDGAGALDCP